MRLCQRLVLTAAAGLLLAASAGAQSVPEEREARWVADHVSLDLLPVAYVVPRGHFSLGGSMNMPPVGLPASRYSLYPDLQYGAAARTQVALGVAGADRPGRTGEALFYTLGVQRVLLPGTRTAPTVSLGGYGFLAPHDLHGGVAYLVASQKLTPQAYPHGAFAHVGLELQSFAGAGSRTGVQPFVGANYAWSRRLRFSAEFRSRMTWERHHLYSLKGVILLYRGFGLNGGFRDNGYRAEPFIGIEID